MAKITLIFAALLILNQQNLCKADDSPLDVTKYLGYAGNVLKLGKELYSGAQEIIAMLQPKTSKESESDIKITPGMEQRITDQIKHVSKKLDSLKVDMQNMKEEIIDKILNEMPDILTLKENLYGIYKYINQVENLFQNFIHYISEPTEYRNSTLMNFAEHATSHDLNELPNVLKTIHWMLIQSDVNAGESILTLLSRSTQAPKQMCKRQQSLQQMLYSLFNTIVLADIKGHAMIQVSYKIIQLFAGGRIDGEAKLAELQFQNRIINTLREVKSAMSSASRAVWRCDSYESTEDVTFTRLNNVFQKYMVNEVDLNWDGTCTQTCPDYKQTYVHGCYNEKICAEQRICHGTLWNCEYKIASTFWICPSNKQNRRYEYLEHGNSQRYGPKGTCSKPSIEMSSWTRGTVACSYCLCTCDDLGYKESDRYVNLRPSIADIHNNFVVTGIAFKKVNHVLHIQIQEGKILPNGEIDNKTVTWKSVDNYNIHDRTSDSKPRENLDYFAIKYYTDSSVSYPGIEIDNSVEIKKTAVNLDDLDFATYELSGEHVLTGLKFSVDYVKGSGNHLSLEVLMTPFNFTTGKIDPKNSVWYSSFRALNGQKRLVLKSDKVEVNIENLDIPTNSGAAAVPTSQNNQFLYFTTSSLDTDVGQNTIPFIDLQEVVTNPPTPLSGAGIFHKSSPGSGGFLAPKIFTFNYEPHL